MNDLINSDIFTTSLRQTMKTEYDRITTTNTSQVLDNALIFSGDLSNILDDISINQAINRTFDHENIIQFPSSPLEFTNSYSNTNCELPNYSDSLMDEYFRFFFDYERNSEEAKSKFLIGRRYTVDNLIEEVKLDIFIWIATELLFLPPEKYRKKEMSRYCEFEDYLQNTERRNNVLYCSERDWKKFQKNRKILTERIKSFPMPPHFIRVYTNSKIKKAQDTSKIDPAFNFFTDTNAYKHNSLEDYHRLKTKIIGIPIEDAKKGLYKEHSLLLNVLVNYYIERVYGFQLVNCLIDVIANKKMLHSFPYPYPIGLAKILKSNNLFFSKRGLYELVMNYPNIYIPLFKAIEVSFQSIARRTFDNFVIEYRKQYTDDPLNALIDEKVFTKMLGILSELFNDLSTQHRKKHKCNYDEEKNDQKQSEEDEDADNIKRLLAIEKWHIMQHIADPTNLYDFDILRDLGSTDPLMGLIMGTTKL